MKDSPFATNCRVFRARLGVSQAALGAMIGYKQNLISAWEGGKRQPNASQIIQLAAALNIQPGDLLAPVPERSTTTQGTAKTAPQATTKAPKRKPIDKQATATAEPPRPEPKKAPRRRAPAAEKAPKKPATNPGKRSHRKTASPPTAA